MLLKRPESRSPIPNNAKEVFTGKIFSVYQWEQEQFDGTKTIFEKIKRTDTVSVIPVTSTGEIILSEQQQPNTALFIGCLGGRIDEGESPLEAAKRELREEAGMGEGKYVLWDSVQPLGKIDWAIYTFIAQDCMKVQKQQLDAGEKIKLIYVTFDKFIEITRQENFRDTEIALKVYRLSHNPTQLDKFRKLIER